MYSPGKPAVSASTVTKGVHAPKPARKPVVLPTISPPVEVAATTDAPVAPHPDGTAGNNALGTGTVTIMFIQAFPNQRPDVSSLPAGTSGDVVVDVLIDSNGRVSKARTKKGMGHGIDEMVVATVEQWIFHPATKDGRPVTSEQELHFHYDRARDPGCGWECFALAP